MSPRRAKPRSLTSLLDSIPRGGGARVAPNRARLRSLTPKKMKKSAVAGAVGQAMSNVGAAVELTPGHPKTDAGSLEVYSPISVDSGPIKWAGGKVTDGVALLSSKYRSLGNPAVQVRFDPLSSGIHLVELRLGMIQSDVKYHFRLLGEPGIPTEEVQVSHTKSVFKVIQPLSGYSGPYAVTFMQLNPQSGPQAAWWFHSVGIWPTS
jgi:hypothetical protein